VSEAHGMGRRASVGTRRVRLPALVGAVLLLALLVSACVPPPGGPTPHVDVSFDKTPARDTTTVTVSVANFTVTNVTVRVDSPAANPLTTSTAPSFQFALDTTTLKDGPHTLYVVAQGASTSVENDVQFGVDNSQTALPAGFQQSTVFNGLNQPTAIRFSPDGRVFIAEKSGLILVFDSLTDTVPKVFADLRTDVYDAWDRGLLGLALDPGFPSRPYVYVLYARDALPGGTSPHWNDSCPTPPGGTEDGCVVTGRLARLTASGDTTTGSPKVLVDGWCQQFPSHSIGDLHFGADGALYASGGEGANWLYTDYGQAGSPLNPCGDPPAGVGGTQTPPTAQGGALRSQDTLTTNDPTGDPTGFDGTVIRVNPDTGAAMPDNPLASSPDPNARKVVAYGLRNPFRFAVRPGTNELWIGDVGWNSWEEIDRVPDPRAAVTDFGWPCYEGPGPQPGYQAVGLNVCTVLYYFSGLATPPYYTYNHKASVAQGDGCPTGGSSVSGGVFYNGGRYPGLAGNYPSKYDGALFFADYTRRCIWAMLPGSDGLPDPTRVEAFATGTAGAYSPVDLETGPGGDLYYVDLPGGTIRRIRYYPNNRPPVPALNASATSGAVPLTVHFDASASTDPDADPLTYSWDLDGNGVYGDAAGPTASFTYSTAGVRTVGVRVSDPLGATATATVVVSAGNDPPSATITAPTPSFTWKVNDVVSFSGSGTDAQDGTLPASAFTWTLDIRHCPSVSTCHTHPVQTWSGITSGSFVAPDHEYPSHLELWLTVKDSGGLSDTKLVELYPKTSTLSLASSPTGASIGVGDVAQITPFSLTVITGSTQSITAPNQTLGGQSYAFQSWSDGGAQSHQITVPGNRTLTATFVPGTG
jgi:glucose/arabinose dehydrogenase